MMAGLPPRPTMLPQQLVSPARSLATWPAPDRIIWMRPGPTAAWCGSEIVEASSVQLRMAISPLYRVKAPREFTHQRAPMNAPASPRYSALNMARFAGGTAKYTASDRTCTSDGACPPFRDDFQAR